MRIAVVGATGALGRATVARLRSRHEVVAVVRADPGDLDVEVREAPLGAPQRLAEAFARVHAVVHAAGIWSPRAAPRALRWVHVAGTENVVNAAVHAGVRRLVHVACADVTLHDGDRIHWAEGREPPRPFGERARTLQLAEQVALTAGGGRLEPISLRPAWVWGPGASRMPGLAREAAAGGIQLHGPGRNLFASCYIDHAIDGVVGALEAGDEALGRAYYLDDGAFQDAVEFFGALSAALELPRPRRAPSGRLAFALAQLLGGGRPDVVLQRTRGTAFDLGEASGQLGFAPRVSREEGLAALKAWVKAQGGVAALAARPVAIPDAQSVDAQVHAAGGD
jgi:nucleoside-diphosphate-sugar epimerase